MPNWCALRAWWKISRLARTWKIKTYWENNHILRVIEDFRGYTQSLAKPLTTRACKRHPRFMDFSAWCLPYN